MQRLHQVLLSCCGILLVVITINYYIVTNMSPATVGADLRSSDSLFGSSQHLSQRGINETQPDSSSIAKSVIPPGNITATSALAGVAPIKHPKSRKATAQKARPRPRPQPRPKPSHRLQPHDILLVTVASNLKRLEYTYALQNHEQYAAKHGYHWKHVLCDWSNDRPPAWAKINILRHLMNTTDYQWFWMLDADALIMNQQLRLEKHILKPAAMLARKAHRSAPDLILSRDCNDLNTGSLFIHKSNWSMEFLEKVWTYDQRGVHNVDVWWEQAVIIDMMKRQKAWMAPHVQLVPQGWLNSFEGDCGHRYREGDFVIHFPGTDKSGFFRFVQRQKRKLERPRHMPISPSWSRWNPPTFHSLPRKRYKTLKLK